MAEVCVLIFLIMPLSVEILKASYGDAFVLHCQDCGKEGTVVVDGGPKTTSLQIVRKLRSLGHIDLMVLSHYDHDHIAGLYRFISSHVSDNPFPVSEIWCNCAHHLIAPSTDTKVSYSEAYDFASVLQNIKGLEWKGNIQEGLVQDYGFCRIHVLSPTEDGLERNLKRYGKVVNKCVESQRVRIAQNRRVVERQLSLADLALNEMPKTSANTDLINKASIAFVLECDGKSILMMGDARAENIVTYLNSKGYSAKNPLNIDCMKVSHHGSRNNISVELLDMLYCEKFIISTDGGYGNSYHPDRETVAKLLCHPCRNSEIKRHLYFNYPLEKIMERVGGFIHQDEFAKYNFEIHDNVNRMEL